MEKIMNPQDIFTLSFVSWLDKTFNKVSNEYYSPRHSAPGKGVEYLSIEACLEEFHRIQIPPLPSLHPEPTELTLIERAVILATEAIRVNNILFGGYAKMLAALENFTHNDAVILRKIISDHWATLNPPKPQGDEPQ